MIWAEEVAVIQPRKKTKETANGNFGSAMPCIPMEEEG